MTEFKCLTNEEMMDIEGGAALAILVALFVAGFAGGIATGNAYNNYHKK